MLNGANKRIKKSLFFGFFVLSLVLVSRVEAVNVFDFLNQGIGRDSGFQSYEIGSHKIEDWLMALVSVVYPAVSEIKFLDDSFARGNALISEPIAQNFDTAALDNAAAGDFTRSDLVRFTRSDLVKDDSGNDGLAAAEPSDLESRLSEAAVDLVVALATEDVNKSRKAAIESAPPAAPLAPLAESSQPKTIERVIERVIETKVVEKFLDEQKVNQLNSQIDNLKKQQDLDRKNFSQIIALSNKIDSLTDITVSGVTGLKDSDIPDDITVSNYLQLGGGNLTGSLKVGTTSSDRLLSVHGGSIFSGDLTLASFIASGTATTTELYASSFIKLGTTSPSQILSVQGNALFSGNISSVASIVSTGTIRATQSIYGSSTIVATGDIFGFGNLAVGTTSPSRSLSVQGNSIISGALDVANLISTGTATTTELYTIGFVKIGTSSPSRTFSLQGDALISGNLSSVAAITASDTITVLGSATSSFAGVLSVGSSTPHSRSLFTIGTSTTILIVDKVSGKIGFGTTSPTYHLSLQNRDLTFEQDGQVEPWKTNGNSLPTALQAHWAIAVNGYLYIIGGVNSTPTNQSAVYYAKINSDGSVASFSTNSFALPKALTNLTSQVVSSNGYIYVVGGNDGNQVATTYYAKLNSDGSTGPWITNRYSLPVALDNTAVVVANEYIYVMGGRSSSGQVTTFYYGRVNADGSVGPWKTNSNGSLSNARSTHSAVVANGYVYIIGGLFGSSKTETIHYASINSDGTTSGWNIATAMPKALQDLSAIVLNGYLYVMAGADNDSDVPSNDVSFARIDSSGALSSWASTTVLLPNKTENHASAVYNGYMYVIGGSGNGGLLSAVYYTSPQRIRISGSLDLLSLNTGALVGASDMGNTGGSIVAGDIFAKGFLDVSGNARFWNSVGIDDSLSVSAKITTGQDISIFSVNNSTTTPTLFTVLYDGRIGIGTSTPQWLVQITGSTTREAMLVLSDQTAASNLKHWTLSSQGGEFYIATSSDAYATSSIPAFMINSNGNVGIGTTSPGSRLSIQGNCSDTGGGDGCADYAELYPSSEPVESGDLVMLDPDHPKSVKKALSSQRNLLIGAVSTNPAIVIEGSSLQLLTGSNYHNNSNKPAIALAGKIPVKVNLEGGQIAVGDPIAISSEPGVGRKTSESGKIIGYALESYPKPITDNQQPTTNNQILIFVNLGYWINPDVTNDSQLTTNASSMSPSPSSSLLSSVVDIVKSWLESMQVVIENGVVRLKELVVEKIKADKLCIGETCVTEDELKSLLSTELSTFSTTTP